MLIIDSLPEIYPSQKNKMPSNLYYAFKRNDMGAFKEELVKTENTDVESMVSFIVSDREGGMSFLEAMVEKIGSFSNNVLEKNTVWCHDINKDKGLQQKLEYLRDHGADLSYLLDMRYGQQIIWKLIYMGLDIDRCVIPVKVGGVPAKWSFRFRVGNGYLEEYFQDWDIDENPEDYENIILYMDSVCLVQTQIRKYLAVQKANELRCLPEHLFDREHGTMRRKLMEIDDVVWGI